MIDYGRKRCKKLTFVLRFIIETPYCGYPQIL